MRARVVAFAVVILVLVASALEVWQEELMVSRSFMDACIVTPHFGEFDASLSTFPTISFYSEMSLAAAEDTLLSLCEKTA